MRDQGREAREETREAPNLTRRFCGWADGHDVEAVCFAAG